MKISGFRNIIVLLLSLTLLAGCEKEPACPGGPGCEPTEGSHTFVMYAVGNNNLWRFLRGNINMAIEAVAKGIPANSRVLVYYDGPLDYLGNSRTALTEIVREGNGAVERVLKTYDEQNSADPAVMNAVWEDVEYFAPAEVYGAAFLGHGTGWFPPELNNLKQPRSGSNVPEHDLRRPENSLTRAYGPDGTVYMSTEDMARGLAPIHFDYLIFDVCFMASAEFLYELRDNADYIVASPAEVMGNGIPYHKLIPVILNRSYGMERRLANAVNTIVGHYMEAESYKSASFTVVATAALPALADAVKGVFASAPDEPRLEEIQSLEVLAANHAFFDLKDYMQNITSGAGAESKAAYSVFETALANVIVAERHTPTIYSALGAGLTGGFFDASKVSGISSYIPRDYLPVTRAAYYATSWGKYVRPESGSLPE